MLRLRKDVSLDRIEHKFSIHCSNPVVNSCFLISNPHMYNIRFKKVHAVYIPFNEMLKIRVMII